MLPFCPNCGASVQPNSNFCPVCGARLTPTQYAQQTPPPPPPQYYQQPPQQPAYQQPPSYQQPQQSGERVVSVVPTLKKMKLMGAWDTYALIVTERRAIFCHITNDMVNKAIKEAQEKAKAEGKGFWGQWGAQLDTSFFYTEKYKSMPPEQALREQPDNFALEHSEISRVVLWQKSEKGNQVLKRIFWEVEFESRRGKEKYVVDLDPENALTAGFGSKLHV